MVVSPVDFLAQIAAFLKVPSGKISLNDDSLPVRVVKNAKTTGYFNIISQFLLESKSHLGGSTSLESAQIRQWIDYALIYILLCNSTSNINQVFKLLNDWLESRTYIISHKITIADVLLYYIIYNIMVDLSNADKEKFVNVSRWFDNLQQDKCLRQNNKMIDFRINYLNAFTRLQL